MSSSPSASRSAGASVRAEEGRKSTPASAGSYRLTYELDASAVQPVSTRVRTAWTFRSTGPSGVDSIPVSLLSVDYALPLDVMNRPAGSVAGFTVHQTPDVAPQEITSVQYGRWFC